MRANRGLMVSVAVVAALVATVGSAVAVTSPPAAAPLASAPSAADVVAPVVAVTEFLDGPVQDATDPEVVEYAAGSGFVRVPERAAEALIATPLDEEGFAALAQDAYDSLLHMKPGIPLTHALDTGHPAYTPDWNGNGRFGEAADYDHDVDAVPDTALFRYPCTGYDGVVTFERVTGGCGPDQGSGLKTGVVREVRIVNARGFVLDATIWIPGEALRRSCAHVGLPACARPDNVRPGQPSVVFNNGLASRQDHYYWYATALARAGYVVLTFDPTGQGESEGTMQDLLASVGGCNGSCLDAQDVLRWWAGESIRPLDAGQTRPFGTFKDPAYLDQGGDNVRNPYLRVLDPRRRSISGNSLGAGATVSYLNAMTDGAGYDGRPVPPVAAAVPLSIPGETRVSAPVPTLMVTGDLDGIPLVAPAVLGQGWADDHQRMFSALRRQAPARAVGVVVIEGGMHTDHVDQAFIPSTTWGIAVTERYAISWLDCHVRGQRSACRSVLQTSPHLSRAFPSQVDPDGSGPAANVCLQAADQASLGHEPDALVAALLGDHAPCEA